uniref:Cytochrome c oxidase assembly factor 8 n=1 Tax=Oreochromis aureus TaxID=47969 RepID=A0AAZ1XXC5_OREAU
MPVSNQTEFADTMFCIWIVLPLFSSLSPGAFFIPRCSFHLEVCWRSTYRPEPSSTHDWVGPPNPLSNLRPIIYHIPDNETELEKRLRNLRQETEDWNHNFWAKQNITFSKEKEAFIISQLKAKGLTLRDEDGRRRSLSSEEMATFYKNFLDKNRVRHANYNKEWYRRNFTITLLMARVTLNSMWRTVTERQSSKKNGTPTS